MNESCDTYIYTSHVTHMKARHIYEEVKANRPSTAGKCNGGPRSHTYERDIYNTWTSHVTHLNDLCHTYKWVMLYIWLSHVNLSELRHMYQRVTMSHVTRMNESQCTGIPTAGESTHQPHVWMSHATHTHQSCHTYERVALHIWTQINTYEHI